MNSITQQLADFAARAKYEDLPQPVVHETKRLILDSLGCALAGMATDKGRLPVHLAQRLGGPRESSIIGARGKVSCAGAAFANGELINALDFDAILRPVIHATPFVFPPALALAESRKATGQQVILATVLGHEIACRVGSGLPSPRNLTANGPDRGKMEWVHIHGYSSNVFGAATAAGKMLGFDGARMAEAFGIAGYNAPMQASAKWDQTDGHALTKFASGGWIAQTGLTAALLAETGYTGDITVLDGDHGFWKFAGATGWRAERVTAKMGQDWHLLNTRYKLYPCCGIIQGPLDCLTDIIGENHLRAKDIDKVQVWLDPHSEMPLWQNNRIDNEMQAQFSVAYVVAVAASGLPLGKEWQEPAIRNSPDIRKLMERVSFSSHPEFGIAALSNPAAQMARVDVRARGRTFSKETSTVRGSAAPKAIRATDRQLEDKFRHNASAFLPIQRIEKTINAIWALERLENVSGLTSLLASKLQS